MYPRIAGTSRPEPTLVQRRRTGGSRSVRKNEESVGSRTCPCSGLPSPRPTCAGAAHDRLNLAAKKGAHGGSLVSPVKRAIRLCRVAKRSESVGSDPFGATAQSHISPLAARLRPALEVS